MVVGHNRIMPEPSRLVPRQAESLVAESLADTRGVLVNGARQVGKSTLTRLAAARRPRTVTRLLDDPANCAAAITWTVSSSVGIPRRYGGRRAAGRRSSIRTCRR